MASHGRWGEIHRVNWACQVAQVDSVYRSTAALQTANSLAELGMRLVAKE